MSEYLTPTQDLIMELLAARDRLDDQWWPIPSRHRAALNKLEMAGLVHTMHGMVENTVRANITDAGRAVYQLEPYGPRR